MDVGKLKRKGDWIGLIVRLDRDVVRGDKLTAHAGSLMLVVQNRGGLHLHGIQCERCGVSFRVVGVDQGAVQVVKRVAEPEWHKDYSGRTCGASLPATLDRQVVLAEAIAEAAA